MNWKLLSILLAGALCLCGAAVGTQPNLDEADDRPQKQGRALEVQSCKSVIAIGGWSPSEGGTAPTAPVESAPSNCFTTPYADEASQIGTDEEFVCEFDDGTTLPIEGTEEQMLQLRALLNSGELVSAQSSVEVSSVGGSEQDEELIPSLPEEFGSTIPDVVTLPAGAVKVVDKREEAETRRLATNMYEGVKKVLVVKVRDSEGLAVPEGANFISNKFFGTNGDRVTMTSGFRDCSFGRMLISNDYGDAIDEDLLSAPGVVEVRINIKLRESTQSQIRNKVAVAVQQKLSVALPGPFDHVVFVLAECFPVGTDCRFEAYAFVNYWLSVFVRDNYKFPAVQMHEIGHNLNLAHSGGLDGGTYSDHTCLMGNPLWEDNLGKNFQMNRSGGWYANRHIAWYRSGTIGGTSWSGRLVGVAEYNRNPADHPIVLKLETGKAADWFVGFNRAVGANAHNVEADNHVTIYKVTAGEGAQYSQSFLKGKLRKGQCLVVTNWRKTGHDLVITAHDINTAVTPGYANLGITFGPPTPLPTKQPTRKPTRAPSPAPMTDEPSPQPNSPTSSPVVSTSSPSKSPTAGPTPSPSANPSSSPSKSPSKSCVNDPSWTYITKKGKTKLCDPWVQRKPSRRCNKINDAGVSSFDACPAYCNPACL
ncbi:hypothetical protein ACHAXT_001383 [Thalassiosira profunda]